MTSDMICSNCRYYKPRGGALGRPWCDYRYYYTRPELLCHHAGFERKEETTTKKDIK